MSYLPPPSVAFGEEITPFALNRLRQGLTQWEQFFNFTAPPPDIQFTHRPARFVMWSYEAASVAETLQFNAGTIWGVNVFAFVLIASLRIGSSVNREVGQIARPSSGSNSLTAGEVVLRVYANGNITLQHTTTPLRKTLVVLTAMM